MTRREAWEQHQKDPVGFFNRTHWLATVETPDGELHDWVMEEDTEDEAKEKVAFRLNHGWDGTRLVGWRPYTFKESERDRFEQDEVPGENLKDWDQLTPDAVLDMWQKAKGMTEPNRSKAMQQVAHLSKQLESRPAMTIVDLLLESLTV